LKRKVLHFPKTSVINKAQTRKLACQNCGKAGHVAERCYLKDKREVRVN